MKSQTSFLFALVAFSSLAVTMAQKLMITNNIYSDTVCGKFQSANVFADSLCQPTSGASGMYICNTTNVYAKNWNNLDCSGTPSLIYQVALMNQCSAGPSTSSTYSCKIPTVSSPGTQLTVAWCSVAIAVLSLFLQSLDL
jgi:hypothetical protein